MPLAAATAGAVRVLTVTSPGGRAMSCLAPEPDPITQPVSAASRERAYLVDEVCPFCADDQSLAGGLHPDVPLAPVWAGSHWRLFADLTAEAIGCCLLAPPRPVASVTEMEPGEASQLGATLHRLAAALQAETSAQAVYLYAFDHPHLHIHLAPHRPGDPLGTQIIQGSQVTGQQGGLHWATSAEFPPLPRDTVLQTAGRVRERLRTQTR
jgi:diadenosine tetraphosphate (Ap4A) HIT family hydrolase